MKRTLFICMVAMAAMFAGCSKEQLKDQDDLIPACEQNNTGTLMLQSLQSDHYELFIDGVSRGSIAPGATATIDLSVGYHALRTEQINGWLVYPTIFTGSVVVGQCQVHHDTF